MPELGALSARERWLVGHVGGPAVLDIGFAGQKGTLPKYYAWLRAERPDLILVGLDFNQEAVVARRQPYSIVADAAALPVRCDTINCVVMAEFLEHHVHIEPFIREAQRVLRVGGCLLVTTPNPLFANRIIKRWLLPSHASLVTEDNLREAMGFHDHRVFWDPLSLAHLVTRSGMRIERITTLGTWLPGMGRLVSFFRRGLAMDFWPANRFGYITCVKCVKVSNPRVS